MYDVITTLCFQTEAEREWFAQRIESSTDTLEKERRIEIAKEMLHSQAWDKFLSIKYPTVKRYCGEGAESLLTFFSTLFRLTTSGKFFCVYNLKILLLCIAENTQDQEKRRYNGNILTLMN